MESTVDSRQSTVGAPGMSSASRFKDRGFEELVGAGSALTPTLSRGERGELA
jgi:hypothetical protein